MTWTADGPQGNEASKIKYLIVPYTRGSGLDIGCGPFKAYPHFIGVDNHDHVARFGWPAQGVDVVADCRQMRMFADGGLDFVFSSHTLEHIEDHKAALAEWWRVIRVGGHLVLYLPHRDLYPNIGQPGGNPDHKHDFHHDDIVEAMRAVAALRGQGWTLVENETRDKGHEYSFFQAFRKEATPDCKERLYERNPGGKQRCLLIRYGAYGDQVIAASVVPELKKQGWHVTYQTAPPADEVLIADPHIDEIAVQDKDQVPNQELGPYWKALEERYDRIINLSESVEGTLLAMPGRIQHQWPDGVRRQLCNVNYLERTHDIAEVPHVFHQRFYPTAEEREWAAGIKEVVARSPEHGHVPVVVWALAGSSLHKAWPWVDVVLSWLMKNSPVNVLLMGGKDCTILEEGALCGVLEAHGVPKDDIKSAIEANGLRGLVDLHRATFGHDRVVCTSGNWSIRQSLAFSQVADLVVGPETGVLNAVAFEPMPKVVMLSHSSIENLTKHWINTQALTAPVPCYPCHRMHYTRDFCPQDEQTHAAACAAALTPVQVFHAIVEGLGLKRTKKAA